MDSAFDAAEGGGEGSAPINRPALFHAARMPVRSGFITASLGSGSSRRSMAGRMPVWTAFRQRIARANREARSASFTSFVGITTCWLQRGALLRGCSASGCRGRPPEWAHGRHRRFHCIDRAGGRGRAPAHDFNAEFETPGSSAEELGARFRFLLAELACLCSSPGPRSPRPVWRS